MTINQRYILKAKTENEAIFPKYLHVYLRLFLIIKIKSGFI